MSSFRWLLLVSSVQMWKCSRVFKCALLFCSCNICIMLWMGPKECVWSIRFLAKSEERLAVLNAFLCSRNRVAKLRPVCPTYTFPQSGHVNL